MALKLNKITLKNGIEINEPYFKITLVSYNDELKEISYAGAVYLSEEARRNGFAPIEELRVSGNYSFEDKAANYFEEAYNHLKKESKKIKHMTKEDVFRHNEDRYIESAKTMAPPKDIIDVNNLLFIDSKDC